MVKLNSGSYAGGLGNQAPGERAQRNFIHRIAVGVLSALSPWPPQVADSSVRQGQLSTPKQTHSAGCMQTAQRGITGQGLHARLRGSPTAWVLPPCYRHLRTCKQTRPGALPPSAPSGEPCFRSHRTDESTISTLRRLPQHGGRCRAARLQRGPLSASQLGGFQLPVSTPSNSSGLCAACQEAPKLGLSLQDSAEAQRTRPS